MSLLPALFQNTDPMPMTLGAKIVAPVPKKPDPFKAFEKGDYAPNGLRIGVDFGRSGEGGWITISAEYVRDIYRDAHPHVVREWLKGDFGPVEVKGHAIVPTSRGALVLRTQEAVYAATARGVPNANILSVLKTFGALSVPELTYDELPRATAMIADLAAPYIVPARHAYELAVGMPTFGQEALLRETCTALEAQNARQDAIAAKMAEVQRQKQELRALTRKDGKR